MDFASLARLVERFPKPKRRELHCHPSVVAYLRMTLPEAEPEPPWSGAIGSLTGIPIMEKPELEPCAWEFYEDGEMVDSGTLRNAVFFL